MASFIAPLLKDALSKYFSNFDAEKLTLGMFGNVTLSDLALQTDVLDQFNLPFRVLGGRVGKLYLDIGLGGLAKLAMGSTTIIEATLTDVHILAVPPSTFPYDKEKAEAAILAKKRSELSSIVEKQKAAAEAAAKGDSGESSGGGFVPNLILGVINNIKVKIENIHIRYEDDKMKPESPFSFGIVFGSLEAETCDKDWEPAKVELDPTFFKLVQVKSYGFYWNSYEKNLIGANKEANDESLDAIVTEMKALTEEGSDGKLKYVLGPLETKVKAMVTLNPEKLETPFSLPKADVKIEMPELKIGLSNEQFGEALILGESMEAMQRAMPYRKYRPFNTPVKGHAKEWWKFAFNCTQDELKRRKQNCTWDFWKAHRELVKKYTAAYPAIARGTATDEEKEEAQKLEDQMDNISIMTVRNKIDLTVTREKEMIKAKSGYWSTYELTEDDLQEILTKDMTEDEKLAYSTKVEEEAKPVAYPKDADYVEIRANVDLAKTVLNITNTSKDSDKIDNVLKLVIDKFSASAETHPEKQGLRVDAAMSTISITGLEQEGRPLPQLLKSVGEEGTEFVSFTFEKNPFDSKAGSRVKFSSLRTDVIYHAPTVQKLVDTFTWPDQVELSSAKASMSSSIDNFKQSSLDGMQDAVKDTSSQIDVDIKITAPRILVPQNGELSDTASVLIVNLGTLTVKSISHADAETLDLKALAENTNVDPALAKLVYNEYAVKLSDFEVLMALAGENLDLPGYTATLGEAGPLLKKGQIVVELSQSKITTDPRFPKLKVEVQIPLLDVDISESRMDKLMQLGLTFPVPVMAPPRPSIVDVKNDAKANYDAEVAKLTSSTVAISGAAEKKEKVEQVIPSDFDPETATQLTNIFCHVDIQGIKLRVSKVEGNAELIPVLDILLGVVDATVKMRTYGIGVKATLSGFVVTYSGAKIRGYDGPVNLLETPSGSGAPLLTLDVFMLSDDSPKPASGSVKQQINAQITSLNVILHQEAINALLVAADRIKNNLAKIKEDQAAKTFVIAGASGSEEAKADALVAQKAAKSAKAEENPNDLAMKVNAVLTSFTLQLTCEAKRITEVAIRQLAVEYDDGPVKSTAVVKLEAVEILDKAESAKYPKIVSVTGTEKLLYVKVLLFKESATRGETEPDIDVTLNLGSPRLMIIGSFFGNVLNFVTNFQEAVDAVAKASAEASKNAMEAVKDAYESNAAKIKVQLKIGAPEIFVPRSATSNEVLALVLGEFQINNGFTSVASNVANRNAIVDTATVSLAGVSLGKAILDDNSNIIVQSMFIEPITLKFDFGRNLSSSWYKELPQFRVDADLEQFIVIIASEDVSFGMLCLLDVGKSLLEVKTKPKTQAIEADSPLGPQARMLTIQMAGSIQEKPEEKADTRTWLFSLKGKIKKIGVAFYTGPTNLENRTGSVPRDAGLSIGELSIQTASCSAEVWTNMDITANITINDAVIKDTRVATSNVITNCLTKKSDREGVQSTAPILAVDFSQTLQSSGQKLIDAGIQTTGVEFVINFDFFKAVLDVLMKIKDEVPEIIDEAKKCQKALAGDEGASDEDEVEVVAPVEQVEEAKPSNMLINGKVRFDELNVLILEDATTTDTNAIELTLGGTFDVNSKVTETHGSGEIKFGFATTNYRTRAIKKLAEIIRFSALKIKVDLTPERKVDVDIVYPDLACRFSAGTILLLAKIGGVASKAFAPQPETEATEEDNSDAWNVKENKGEDYWFMKPELTAPPKKKNVLFITGAVENVASNEIKERIGFTVASLAISLEVGVGSLTTPLALVDGSLAVEVTNFTSDLLASGNLRLSAAYNNIKIGAWEYLLEPVEVPKPYGDPTFRPWNLLFSASKPAAKDDSSPPPPITVTLRSEELLELTVSKTGISALKKIGDTFAKAQNALSEDDVKSTPYSFKNDVGTPITLTLDEASPFVYVKKDEVIYGNIEVAPGETADLGLNLHITSTENQKPLDDRTLAISIPAFQFSETVSVGRPQARYFPISRKSSSSGEQEGFIIDVATEGFSVAITARSLIKVKNEVDIPVDIRTPEGISIGTIQPTGSFNVPLDVVYDNPGGLYVNPTGYTLSTVPLKWDSLRTKRKLLWSPISMDKAGKGDTSHLKVIGEQLPAMEGNGNRPTNIPHNFVLTIKPQVVLNNLLPIPVELVLPSGTQYNVESGRTLNAFSLPPGTYEREFSFLLRLPNFRGQTWTGQVHLLPNDQLLNPLIVTSKDKRHKLCLGYKTDGKEDGKKVSKSDPVTISLYSSYWMVNYTGLNLFYKSADGQNVVQHSTQELGPIMIGPESSLGHGKPTPSTQIKCENSDWSQQLPLDNNTGVPTCVFLHEAKRVYQLTVSCELSSCGLTRIVTVSARYSIVNSCPYPLVVQEVDVPTALTQVPALRSMAFWPKGSANRIKVKAVGTEDYTADVPYNKPFDNVLRLPNKHGGIRASIMESSTSTSITFSKYTELEVPLLIVNDTQDARIEFHQLGGASRQANAGQSVQYAWDSFHTAESLQWAVTGNTVQNTVDFSKNEAGELVVGGKHYKWITFTRHLRRILLLSENVALVNAISNLNKALDEKASVDVTLALSGVGVSVVDNVAGKDLLYIRLMSMAPTWEASGGKNFQLLPVIENDIIENGFQNYVQGVLPPGTAQLPNNLQVSYDTMTLHRPTGTQQLRRFDYRPALKVNYKMFPSSMTVDLKVNNLQVDNQIIGAKEPICFNVTPIPHEVSTPSEVHPCIIILKASKVSPPNSSLDLISADLCVQEFDLRADMTLANNMMDFAKPEETGNAHEYYDYYKADYAIGSKKEADYYADQFARSASEKRITIYENVEIHSLKLNITFGLEGVAEGGSFTSMFMGLGSALVNITDKELAIDGLHMQHLRLTATEFGDHIYQHYKSAVMSNAMSLMCGLDVIGNPVKMFSGIGKGLSTMFKDPLQAAMSGNITEGMTSGVEGAKMIVGSVTESLSSVTGVLGKGFDSIGMGFFGSSLGAISGAFKPTGKQASEHAAQVTRMRSTRNVGPTIALKPFSQVLARGDLLKSQLDPQDSGQTIAFVVTNAQFVFLLTTTSAYYAEVQRDMKSLARKIWEAPLFFVDNITLDGNVLSLHTRQQQNLQPVLINDPGMAEWVVPKIQDAIRTAPPPQAPTGQAVGQHGPAQPSLLGGLFGGGGEQQQHQQQPSLLGGLGGIFGGGSSQPQQYQQTVIIRQQQPHIQQQTVYDQTIIIRQQQPQRFGAPPQYRPRPQPPPHGGFSFF